MLHANADPLVVRTRNLVYDLRMQENLLREHYSNRGFEEETTERAVQAVRDYLAYCSVSSHLGDEWQLPVMKTYLSRLIATGDNSPDAILALARYAYLTDHTDVYVYFTSIVGIDGIVRNLSERVASIAGEEKRKDIFDAVAVPPAGSPPETMPPMTREIVGRMQDHLSEEECGLALTGNMHGIPESSFSEERDRFRASPSLDDYLADFHRRSVETLQKHCDEDKVWYEQRVSQSVVDFVAGEPEILGGVREGDVIHATKIPYKPDEWLDEQDPEQKQYLACHCPMARESLKPPVTAESQVPPVWCHCSGGYAKLMFDVIFDEPVEIEVLETILGGAPRCRFAMKVPESIMKQPPG